MRETNLRETPDSLSRRVLITALAAMPVTSGAALSSPAAHADPVFPPIEAAKRAKQESRMADEIEDRLTDKVDPWDGVTVTVPVREHFAKCGLGTYKGAISGRSKRNT